MNDAIVDNKSKIVTYNISDIVPYINWAFFFYAWSMNGKAKEAQQELRKEAEALLNDMEEKVSHPCRLCIV